jgi:hypothetical protein
MNQPPDFIGFIGGYSRSAPFGAGRTPTPPNAPLRHSNTQFPTWPYAKIQMRPLFIGHAAFTTFSLCHERLAYAEVSP